MSIEAGDLYVVRRQCPGQPPLSTAGVENATRMLLEDRGDDGGVRNEPPALDRVIPDRLSPGRRRLRPNCGGAAWIHWTWPPVVIVREHRRDPPRSTMATVAILGA